MSNSTKRGPTTSSQVTASSPVRAMPTPENPSSFSVNRRLISAMRGSSSTINTSIGLSVIPISLPFPTRLFQVFGQADGKEGSAQLAPFNGEISSHFFRQLFRLRQTESPVVPRFRRKPLFKNAGNQPGRHPWTRIFHLQQDFASGIPQIKLHFPFSLRTVFHRFKGIGDQIAQDADKVLPRKMVRKPHKPAVGIDHKP